MKEHVTQNVLAGIGNTPLVMIQSLNPAPDHVEIYAKWEGQNPTGSIKDRIALKMIEQAESEGALTHDRVVIEPTSGNTGIALAMIGVVKGYQVEIVMSEAVSEERRRMIRAFGGSVILTPGNEGTDGAIRRARALVAENPDKYFMPDQFSNRYNRLAHYETTAKEIWQQTGGLVDYFVSAIGTSGTIMGVGSYLKSMNPAIKVVCAHPVKGHYIQGLKNLQEALVPAIYDQSLIDIMIDVESEAAFAMARAIVKEEGIFVGQSSGAAMLAARIVAERYVPRGERAVIASIFPDRGEKYLSTSLFC